MQSTTTEQLDPLYSNFINSLKSPDTKRNYGYLLKQYMKFHNIIEYSSLMVTNKEDMIKQYILHLRSKEASKSQFKMLFSTLKNFYEMNDVEDIKWRKLKRFMGEEVPQHEDRCYNHEEIHTLVQNASLKLKAVILLMASSGVRVGALPTMKLKDIGLGVENNGITNESPNPTTNLQTRTRGIVNKIYKIEVYKGLKGKGQYYTFCTPLFRKLSFLISWCISNLNLS